MLTFKKKKKLWSQSGHRIFIPCWFLQHFTISRKLLWTQMAMHFNEESSFLNVIFYNGFMLGHRPYASVCMHICDQKDAESFYKWTVLSSQASGLSQKFVYVFCSGILSPTYLSEVILTFECQRCLIGLDWRLILPLCHWRLCVGCLHVTLLFE